MTSEYFLFRPLHSTHNTTLTLAPHSSFNHSVLHIKTHLTHTHANLPSSTMAPAPSALTILTNSIALAYKDLATQTPPYIETALLQAAYEKMLSAYSPSCPRLPLTGEMLQHQWLSIQARGHRRRREQEQATCLQCAYDRGFAAGRAQQPIVMVDGEVVSQDRGRVVAGEGQERVVMVETRVPEAVRKRTRSESTMDPAPSSTQQRSLRVTTQQLYARSRTLERGARGGDCAYDPACAMCTNLFRPVPQQAEAGKEEEEGDGREVRGMSLAEVESWVADQMEYEWFPSTSEPASPVTRAASEG